jgi:ParB family chromosome partitioning protein
MTGKSAQERARRLLEGVGIINTPTVDLTKPGRGILGRLEQMTGVPLVVKEVNPARVRVWSLQGRLQDALDTKTVADLIDSMARHGQTTPAIVRPVKGDPDADFEVIDGSRRRFACLHLGTQLKVIVTDLGDREAALLTETADASRKHSAYETGVKWKAWLEAKLFETQDALAQWLQVSPGDLSFKLSLAELPYEFVVAVGGHDRLSRELGRRLAKFIGRARALERLDEIRTRLIGLAAQARDNGWTVARTLVAYGELEAEVMPPRATRKAPIEAPLTAADGKLLGTVASPDKANVTVRWAKPLGAEDRADLVSALKGFLLEWATGRGLAAKESPKSLKVKSK